MVKRRIDARIEFEFLRATEAAAINSGFLVGRGDKIKVDQAAVDAMRTVLGDADIDGLVVIGEGEKDEAPMLYIGEELGTKDGPTLDVAVDPIDGTTLASKGGPGAISVVAAAERGALFHTHIPYMDKIVVGPAGCGIVSIEMSVEENVRALAKAMKRPVSEITVALLERPRNQAKVQALRDLGARVRLFGDGDVAHGILAVLSEQSRIDMLMGIGGATEGVLVACAVRCLGGDMQGRLWLREEDVSVAASEGVDPSRTLALDDLCRSELAICTCTGVTDGELLEGVRYVRGSAFTHSLIISSLTNTVRKLETKHDLNLVRHYLTADGSATAPASKEIHA